MLLRRNLSLTTGSEIITKYSERSPQLIAYTDQRPGIKGPSRRRATSQSLVPRSLSPNLSPSKFLQDQGGIEAIIRSAAKGAYTRSEQWGVNKAFRGAVHNLQAATTTPHRVIESSRWPLDAGKDSGPELAKLKSRFETLKSRNKLLANLLGKAIDDLWIQQRHASGQETGKDIADALSLTVAKLQFIQVYLENPSIPLSSDEEAIPQSSGAPQRIETPETANENGEHTNSRALDTDPSVPDSPTHKPIRRAAPQKDKRSTSNSKEQDTPKIIFTTPAPQASPAKSPSNSNSQRPSISQSSFSWILGPDTDAAAKNLPDKDATTAKLPFATSPPPSAQRRGARERAAYLFGDVPAIDEDGKRRGQSPGGREKRQKDGDQGEEDSFKLKDLGVNKLIRDGGDDESEVES